MRQQAFGGKGKMLKGGLHCHTSRSDGEGTPEEVVRYHYKNGYDFLAITDYNYYNFQNFAPDVPITIIPGMEYGNVCQRGNGYRLFDTLCLGPSLEEGNGYQQDERLELGNARNQEEYQSYLDKIHAKNNLTVLCHPEWSHTPPRFFEKLRGNFAMEIYNNASAGGDTDVDAPYWDEILGQGKVIYGVATDDGHAMCDHCKAWVMVRAEKNTNAILKALKEGAFYSSCGPEIYDFYVRDGKVVLDCSPVNKIRFQSYMHQNMILRSDDGLITHGELDLMGDRSAGKYKYIRATIVDKNGKYASMWNAEKLIGA